MCLTVKRTESRLCPSEKVSDQGTAAAQLWPGVCLREAKGSHSCGKVTSLSSHSVLSCSSPSLLPRNSLIYNLSLFLPYLVHGMTHKNPPKSAASKTAQQVEVLVTQQCKPADLSLVSRTQNLKVAGEDQLHRGVIWLPPVPWNDLYSIKHTAVVVISRQNLKIQ